MLIREAPSLRTPVGSAPSKSSRKLAGPWPLTQCGLLGGSRAWEAALAVSLGPAPRAGAPGNTALLPGPPERRREEAPRQRRSEIGQLVSGVAGWGAREGFLWAEASGAHSGCEFCSEPEPGRGCFLAVSFIYWAGKKVGKVKLGFGDCFSKAEACRLLRRTCTLEVEGCIQELLLLLPSPPPRSLSPLALSSVLAGRKAVYMWLVTKVSD